MRMLTPALALLLLAGCTGYKTKFDVPPHVKTYSVNIFTNKTLERNVDFEFTQALIREMGAKTNLKMVKADEADLLITGEIADYARHSLRRKSRGLKSEMRHQLFVNVAMLDQRKDRMFFEGQDITRRAEFAMNRGETRRQGREEVIRELARRVVSLAFEPWNLPPAKPKEAHASGR
ncbi:hypothetical protein HQ560_11355 [bacterium]|nr:hypothetical protein [bacterium]